MRLVNVKMTWQYLETLPQLQQIDELSFSEPVLVYKHSTRCGICTAVKNELDEKLQKESDEKFKIFFLDLLRHRDISTAIEKKYDVKHQSPQVLIIRDGKCIYSATHYDINYQSLKRIVEAGLTRRA
jgi:monothiol bacilliredoxin